MFLFLFSLPKRPIPIRECATPVFGLLLENVFRPVFINFLQRFLVVFFCFLVVFLLVFVNKKTQRNHYVFISAGKRVRLKFSICFLTVFFVFNVFVTSFLLVFTQCSTCIEFLVLPR